LGKYHYAFTYAFQGRRTEIYALDSTPIALTGNEDAVEYQNKLKEISKTEEYKNFIQQKLLQQK
jgi:hydroxymethylglutaryl-CoA synthase